MDRQSKRHEKNDLEPAGEKQVSANHGCCDCANNSSNNINNNNNNLKQCLPTERYLTKSIEGGRKRGHRKTGHKTASDLGGAELGQDIDEDMFRVLITKPEIAGKPRDNIVFEGDMDLKTTFETSYENLAKMRLDYWKQRQQIGSGDQEQGVSADDLVELDDCSEQSESGNSDVDELDRQANTINSPHEIVPAASVSKQETDVANGDAYKLSSKVDDPSEPIPSQPYIDPDLSSIIVFDANMNRLEKVGVRKRSKYRPSTSLRTGARGLFGDQSEDKEVHTDTRRDEISTNSNEILDSRVGRATKQVPANNYLGKRELALDARNLHSSKQDSHLTYSPQNLPVDSKRKLKDNVNMRDHIKEQNICAKHTDETSNTPLPPPPPPLMVNMADRGSIQANDYLDNLKLAQQEEESAVEELQRVTLLPVQETEFMSCKDGGGSSDTGAKSNSISRQSLLERTCQNQSFCLSENEYPEQKKRDGETGGPRLAASPHGHRYQASYNNLFRESPDFILATRGSMETDHKSIIPMEAQAKLVPKVQLDGHASKMESLVEPETNQIVFQERQDDVIPVDCRVLRLDKEFEYVGSRGGHSYFTEKNQR